MTYKPLDEMTAARRIIPVLLLVAVAAVILCSVTAHAKTAHAAEMISSMDALSVIELAATNPGACKTLIIANCLFATIHDKTSSRFGEMSPQARVYCGDESTGVMAVFGLKSPENPVYITGYVISKVRFNQYASRDACVIMDLTYLQWLVR